LTPSAWAAAWAPFLTTDQNDPSSLCVTIANVSPEPCVSWTFDLPPEDFDPELLPLPLLLEPQAARTRASTRAARPGPPYSRRPRGETRLDEPVQSVPLLFDRPV